MNDRTIELMKRAEVKPTANRITVLRALLSADFPLSLIELENDLETLDRSSISRALAVLLEHGVIHSVEDGRGVTKYEICHGDHACTPGDMHVHFYCEKCNRVYCFEETVAPQVNVPCGFKVRSVNYMLKGVCPECASSFQGK